MDSSASANEVVASTIRDDQAPSFEQLADPKERNYFLNLPTSFVLKPEAVDRLRAVAATLLRQSAEYQRLLKDLGAAPPK